MNHTPLFRIGYGGNEAKGLTMVNKMNVTMELDLQFKEELEELAAEMGITIAEWCALAVAQQVTMQKSMEDLLLQSEQMGISLEEMDLEMMTNQLFSALLDIDDETELDSRNQTPKIILPDFVAKTVKDEDK